MKRLLAVLLVLMCMLPFGALAYEDYKLYKYTDPQTGIVVKYTWHYTHDENNRYWFVNDFIAEAREGECPAGSVTVYGMRKNVYYDGDELTYQLEEYAGAAADSNCTQAYSQQYTYKVYWDDDYQYMYRDYLLERAAEPAHTWSDWTMSVGEDGVTRYTRECIHPVCTIEETYLQDIWTNNGNNTHSCVVLNEGVPVLATEACLGGTATCTHLALCDVCGGEHGELATENHSFTIVYISNGDGTHSLVCDHDAAHVSADAGACTEFKNVDNKDLATHRSVCVACGYVSAPEVEHWAEADDGTCLTPVLCRECGGIAVAARSAHEYEDGVCRYCDVREEYPVIYMDGGAVITTGTAVAGTPFRLHSMEGRDGLTFVGWDKDGDGSADYLGGDMIYVDGPVLTLQAVFRLMCTVTFHEYDGEQDVYYEGYQVSFPVGEPVVLGEQYTYWYKFVGWATEPRGEAVYPAGEKATLTGDVSLYAIVAPFSATIDLGAEDASYTDAAGKPITVLPGEMPYSTLYITNFPVRPGYYFLGFMDDGYYASEWLIWTNEETGEEYIEISLSEDVTLTAIWEACSEHSFNSSGACACGYVCPHDCANGSVCSICGVRVSRRQLTLPDDLTVVEAEAFLGTAEEAIFVPGGVSSIGSRAFANSPSLRAVIFVSGNATIASDALSGSGNAVIIAPAGGSVEAWADANGVPFVEAR